MNLFFGNSISSSLPNYQTTLLGAIVSVNSTTTVNFQLAVDSGQIEGYITDSNLGTPIAAANITVFNQSTVVASGVSDTNGYYLIGGLPPGNYIVNVQGTGYQASSQAAIVQINTTTFTSFGLLSNPGAVQGSVQSNSIPIVNAFVSISVLQGNNVISSTLTDSNGNYLITGIQRGSYVIKANAAGYQIGVQGVNVLANQTVTADFSLISNPGAISGIVTDAVTSGPIPGASVQILQGTVVLNSGLTDSNGTYLISGLAPGSYTISASMNMYQIGFTSAIVTSNATTTANIALQSNPGTISGIVTDSQGVALVGAIINVSANGVSIASAVSGVDGTYQIPGLPSPWKLYCYYYRCWLSNYCNWCECSSRRNCDSKRDINVKHRPNSWKCY